MNIWVQMECNNLCPFWFFSSIQFQNGKNSELVQIIYSTDLTEDGMKKWLCIENRFFQLP